MIQLAESQLKFPAGVGYGSRLRRLAWLFAAVLATACRQSDVDGDTSAATASIRAALRGPSVLVVVHSWTGRTATVGEEIAAMLGGRFLRFADSPFADNPKEARTLTDLAADLGDLRGVHDLYMGFPVWGQEPSGPIRELVSHLKLSGIRVIPFYTFLHHIRPESLEALHASLEDRGALVAPEMAFQVRMNASPEEIVMRARRAVLERAELWAAPTLEEVKPCENGCCPVPAGKAWIGDTGFDAPPGAPPPRLYAVDAFAIDEGEVTVAAYKRCATTGACPEVDISSSFCSELVQGGDELPQPCVSFPQAEAYCRWDGGRLPTEAEWIRAARGQSISIFPWGNNMNLDGDPLRGNFGEKPSTGYPDYAVVPEDSTWPSDSYPGLAPPCSFAAGRSLFGVCDLEGNLSEWVISDAGPAVLGGSWLDGEVTAFRLGLRYVFSGMLPVALAHGKMGSFVIGFRCARAACKGATHSAARPVL